MSIRNAYRQGYNASEIGGDEVNPYRLMNNNSYALAWDKGFHDHQIGIVYHRQHSNDELSESDTSH